MKNVEAVELSIVYTSLMFRNKNASISNQIPYGKTRILDGSLARRGDKFEGGPSQHCLGFYVFCCEAIKNLEAVDLSIVQLFQLLASTSRAADPTSL